MLELMGWTGLSATNIALFLLVGYILGSIPFGLIFAKMAGLGDIRNIGSGNIGATNVLRSGRKGVAAATLLADIFKGAIAVWIAGSFDPLLGLIAGFAAFIGHCFPVWLNFKGGKGVATYVGALFAVSWICGLIFAAVWLTTAAITRISSLSALIATSIIPLALFWLESLPASQTFAIMCVLIWIFHRENINRLRSGTESKIGNKG